MTPREGEVCTLCGYPALDPSTDLCEQCEAWQPIAASAEAAIEFNEQRTARVAPEKRISALPAVSPLLRTVRHGNRAERPA